MNWFARTLFSLALVSLLVFPVPGAAVAQTAPYPSSSVISGVSWETGSISTAAPGSDLWAPAWAADGNLYTGWGDGGGFGGTNSLGRVSLGVARLSGSATGFSGTNIFGGHNGQVSANFVGKPTGMLAVGGALYMAVVEQDAWLRLKITRSTDNGRSWDFNARGWDFAEPDGAFSDLTFLTFGRDYAGARDGYVYAYSQDKRAQSVRTEVAMFRVPTGQIQNRSAYEYYAGLDGSGNPIWTSNINQRQPVFRDPNGVGWGVRVVYNPGLDRYLLTTWHNQTGGWGIFDAPEPWGPWTTVAYYNNWLDGIFKFGFTFNQKWMSADGKTAYMVFSGTNQWDAFVVIKATFTLAGGPGPDTSPPTTPSGLSTTVQSQTRIDLSWNAASDPESGIANYNVYRDGVRVATPAGTGYSDQSLSPGTAYAYRVSATNGAGIEGARSGAKTATTQSPPPPPPPNGGGTTPPPPTPNNPPGTVLISNIAVQTGVNYAVQSDLTVGKQQYIDRPYACQQIPPAVASAAFIQTANEDKNALPGATDLLSFEVDRDVVVYVAHDDRVQGPKWLTSGFTDTGLDLVSGGGTFSLFSRSYPAGPVQLGSNVAHPATSSMYSVIVAPASQSASDTTAPAAPTGLRVIQN